MVFIMKVTCLFFIYLAYVQSSLAKVLRIAGGDTVTIGDFPHQACLMSYPLSEEDLDGQHSCGASIVSEEYLITAAHCISLLITEELKVRTGATNTYIEGEEHNVKRFIIHPDFNPYAQLKSNDIALIQLENPMTFSDIQKPIPLAKPTDKPAPGQSLTVTGYGFENKDMKGKAYRLKAVNLPIDSLSECQDAYSSDAITSNMICAGNSTDSVCFGDSGDPGIIDGKLVAIASLAVNCDSSTKPAIFTAVYEYLDWISKYVKID